MRRTWREHGALAARRHDGDPAGLQLPVFVATVVDPLPFPALTGFGAKQHKYKWVGGEGGEGDSEA